MKRLFAAIAVWFALTNGAHAQALNGLASLAVATASSAPQKTDAKAGAGDRLLIIKPNVELSLLTAAGVPEARADWSNDAVGYVVDDLKTRFKGHPIAQVDPKDAVEGRAGQVFRLNETVLTSMVIFTGPLALPTKSDKFDWTLGDGAKVLADQYGADYALLIVDQGSYASGGRVAAMVVMAAVGVAIPLGQQQASASLVDLRTGQVVWSHHILGGDLRTPDGVRSALDNLLKGIPL